MPMTIAQGTPYCPRGVSSESAKASGISRAHMVDRVMTIGAMVSPVPFSACVNTWTALIDR